MSSVTSWCKAVKQGSSSAPLIIETKACVVFPGQIFVDRVHGLWLAAEPRSTRRSDVKCMDFPLLPRPCWFINQGCGSSVFHCQTLRQETRRSPREAYKALHARTRAHRRALPAQWWSFWKWTWVWAITFTVSHMDQDGPDRLVVPRHAAECLSSHKFPF